MDSNQPRSRISDQEKLVATELNSKSPTTSSLSVSRSGSTSRRPNLCTAAQIRAHRECWSEQEVCSGALLPCRHQKVFALFTNKNHEISYCTSDASVDRQNRAQSVTAKDLNTYSKLCFSLFVLFLCKNLKICFFFLQFVVCH